MFCCTIYLCNYFPLRLDFPSNTYISSISSLAKKKKRNSLDRNNLDNVNFPIRTRLPQKQVLSGTMAPFPFIAQFHGVRNVISFAVGLALCAASNRQQKQLSKCFRHANKKLLPGDGATFVRARSNEGLSPHALIIRHRYGAKDRENFLFV